MKQQKSTVTSKSFVLFKDFNDTLKKLTDDQAGKLIKAVFYWQINGALPEIDITTDLVITPIIAQFKRDNDKYINICERNRANGTKSQGRPRKPKKPNGLTGNPKKPKKPYTDTDTDTDIYSKEFAQFWEVYPKKKGKGGAYKSWNTAKHRPPIEEIVNIITDLSNSSDWKKDGGQYVPMPQTWINQSRWDDETDTDLSFVFQPNGKSFEGESLCNGLTRAQHIEKYGRTA